MIKRKYLIEKYIAENDCENHHLIGGPALSKEEYAKWVIGMSSWFEGHPQYKIYKKYTEITKDE